MVTKWTKCKVAEVAAINPEQLGSKTPSDFSFDYIDISSVEAPGHIRERRRLIFSEAPSRARRIVRNGDILVSSVRPYLRSFAQVKDVSYPTVCSTGFTVLRSKGNVDAGYLYQFILSDFFVNQIVPKMTGSNYPAVNASDIGEAELPLPPLPEQRKIAAILTSVDDAIDATQRIIDQTERVKRGLMQQLLTRGIGHTKFKQTEIGEIPVEWDVVRMEGIINLVSGQSSPASEVNTEGRGLAYVTGPEQWTGSHIEVTKWVEKPRKVAPKDSFFITVKGSGTGTVFPGGEYAIGRDIMAISSRDKTKASNRFLYHVIVYRATEIVKHKVGIVPGISREDILGYSLGLPPLSEQLKIADVLDVFDRKALVEREQYSRLLALKTSLMQVLLTGRVRVKVDEQAEAVV